ncbi:MAG: GNAT family N-acetyltransferase [Thermoflexales bacterium]|nr:GNAT family N-acetyltransferase [Thermoflexales bacterium]
MNLEPVVLVGRVVRLEPLCLEHAEPLWRHADDPEIWRYMPYGQVDTPEKLRALIAELLERQGRATDLCFTVFYQATGEPIGMTRYLAIDLKNRSLEIGGTWYGRAYRGTKVNIESKFLLLRYAFEQLSCIRVQLKADVRNMRSQRAIERLGAVREGVLRKHLIMPDGYVRSSVVYSILDEEWPAVKSHLLALLAD